MGRSYLSADRMSLDELLKLESGLRQTRLGIQLSHAMADEAIRMSQRMANNDRKPDTWKHILIERFPANPDCPSRREVWIAFGPEDIEKAKNFHSYPYWKHAIERGDTVLVTNKMMSWNTLLESDIVHQTVYSTKERLTEWDMKQLVKDASKKFGL